MKFAAWLFDVYPAREGVTVWFIEPHGHSRSCLYRMNPSFYLHLDPKSDSALTHAAASAPSPVSFSRARKKNLYTDEFLDLVEVRVHDPTRFRQTVTYFERFFPFYAFYNSDLLVAQI